jgi:hypothetical protein
MLNLFWTRVKPLRQRIAIHNSLTHTSQIVKDQPPDPRISGTGTRRLTINQPLAAINSQLAKSAFSVSQKRIKCFPCFPAPFMLPLRRTLVFPPPPFLFE